MSASPASASDHAASSSVLRPAVLALLVLAGCGDPAVPPRSNPPGHERMLSALREIASRTATDNPWQGEAAVRKLTQQLDEMGPDASVERQFPVLANLGDALVQVGREREGLARMRTVDEMLPSLRSLLAPGAEAEFLVHYGAAWLRLAETENCCARNAPESCILPLHGAALHSRTEGSRSAMEIFGRAAAAAPPGSRIGLEARWLLNMAAMTLGEFPAGVAESLRIPAAAFAPDEDFPHFENVAKRLGVATFGLAGGVVADDFDVDGDVDLLVSNSDESGQLRLYRNAGDGTFEERTKAANLEGILGGLNMVQGDYDNDGFVDVLVLRGAWFGAAGRQPLSLLRNRGDGTFVDVAFDAGLAAVGYPTQTAAWADFDNDGRLDLFVGGESSAEVQSPCRLYHNEGDGTFADRAATAGVQTFAFVKGVIAGDYDADGFPDVYVSVLGGPNRLYRNRHDGTFEDVAGRLGVTGPQQSFGAFFWDYDEDGVTDLFVSAYPAQVADIAASALGLPFECELPRLYRGDGKGGFTEVGAASNLVKPFSPMGHNFGDMDNDGFLDVYFGTGQPTTRSIAPNLMYRNRGGARFSDVTLPGGFGNLQKGHGVAFADFDDDGDLDVFAEMGGAYPVDKAYDCLFENPMAGRAHAPAPTSAEHVSSSPADTPDGGLDTRFGNHWLAVTLVGRTTNRSAIGAQIRAEIVEDGRRRSVHRTVCSGGSFGANPLRQHLGLGRAASVETLEVRWPRTGKTQVFTGVGADQLLEIVEDDPTPRARAPRPARFGGAADDAR